MVADAARDEDKPVLDCIEFAKMKTFKKESYAKGQHGSFDESSSAEVQARDRTW